MQAELEKVARAVDDLYAREARLFEQDLGERTLTYRLASALERQFPEWNIDCDYNRLGERALKLPKASVVSTDDEIGLSIFPDIVVHRPGIPDNLLALEVRKASNHQPLDHDQHKLRALTDPHLWFAYRIGVCVILGKTAVAFSEVYVGGVIDAARSEWLSERLKTD
jgi:hypothetical protein